MSPRGYTSCAGCGRLFKEDDPAEMRQLETHDCGSPGEHDSRCVQCRHPWSLHGDHCPCGCLEYVYSPIPVELSWEPGNNAVTWLSDDYDEVHGLVMSRPDGGYRVVMRYMPRTAFDYPTLGEARRRAEWLSSYRWIRDESIGHNCSRLWRGTVPVGMITAPDGENWIGKVRTVDGEWRGEFESETAAVRWVQEHVIAFPPDDRMREDA